MTELRDRIANLSPEQRALLQKRLAESTAAKGRISTIEHIPSAEAVPSFGQEMIWALEQLESGAAQFNIGYSLRLTGNLDVAALRNSLTALVHRHETLRTLYLMGDDGQLKLEFPSFTDVPLPLNDLSLLDSDKREESLSAAILEEVNQRIFVDRDLMMRASLHRLDETHHVLQLTFHHAAYDGWSLGVVLHDLSAFYNASIAGTTAQLPELPFHFSDYARWQREQLAGPEGEQLRSYWKKKLEGSSFILELPTDRPRPAQQTFHGTCRNYSVPASLVASIQECCFQEKVTPFMVVLAAYFALLSRYSGQSNILVGSPIAARSRVETESLVGYYVNIVVLRGDLEDDPTFRELLQQVRGTALEAYSHQDMPLQLLAREVSMERDPSRAALYQVMLAFQNLPTQNLELHGLDASIQELSANAARTEIMIFVVPTKEKFDVVIRYNTDIFDAGTIDRLWSHLTTYLQSAIAAPEQRNSKISLLSPDERHQLLEEWNGTGRDYPHETTLAALIEAQVERRPDAVAVVDGEQRLTYKELNERANQLAYELCRRGAAPDRLVGLYVDRSAGMMVALLAILKTGAAYLPLDPLLPAERLKFMLEDSGVRLVVTEQHLRARLTEFPQETVLLDDAGLSANRGDNPRVSTDPEHLAYLMYTSGSTGKPKGVQIPRRALTNFLRSMSEWIALGEHDRLLAVTTISFDISGLEIWLPLLVGAQMVVASREAALDGNALRRLIDRHDITFLQATPVTWQLLFNSGWTGKKDMRAICGGEAMPAELAARLVPAVKSLWNFYGPTETTIWSTGYRITRDDGPILIGRPLANTQCYILDGHQQPVPIGVTGELYIAGDGLARGYLNRPELTAEKFVANPFGKAGTKMYRTGDLALYRSDGNIECLGRIDDQIKIRGYRIELGEIEAVLADQPEVRQAVVMAHEDVFGDKRLVAYVVSNDGPRAEPSELRNRLKVQLPDYMVPAEYIFLDRLPSSPNGKVDRRALPAPTSLAAATAAGYVAPRNPLEETLSEMWAEVLGVPCAGVRDDFFEMGGHSLLAVRLFSKLLAAFPGFQPSLAVLLQAPTVEQFASMIRNQHAVWSCLVQVREGKGRPPFFCVHGAGGNVLSLRDLAMALPSELPFYCLQARGLDGRSTPFASVEETAEHYVELIRGVQPQGPYYLGGGSYGGRVAFEMARRLRMMGQQVGLVTLIDTSNTAYARSLSKPRMLYLNLRFLLRRISPHLRIMSQMRPGEWTSHLSKGFRGFYLIAQNVVRTAAGFNEIPISGDDDELHGFDADGTWIDVLERIRDASRLADRNFMPQPYDGEVFVFSAKQREDHPYRDEALGWRPLALGGVKTCEIDADHDSILSSPAVFRVAEILDRALTEAQHAGEQCVRIQESIEASLALH